MSLGLYSIDEGINVSLSSKVLMIFLSTILGVALIYKVSIGVLYSWTTVNVNVFVEVTAGNDGENTFTEKVNSVSSGFSSRDVVG